MASETPNGQRQVSGLQNTDRDAKYPHGRSPAQGYQGTENHPASLPAYRSQAILAIWPKVAKSKGNNGQWVQSWPASEQRLGTSPS